MDINGLGLALARQFAGDYEVDRVDIVELPDARTSIMDIGLTLENEPPASLTVFIQLN